MTPRRFRLMLGTMVLLGGLAGAGRAVSTRPAGQPASRPAEGAATQPTRPASSRPARLPLAETKPSPARDREIVRLEAQTVKQFEARQYDQARLTVLKILDLDPCENGAWYNLACAQSRLGSLHEAVASLRMALEMGFTGFRHMERDEDLAAVRAHPLYRDLIARKDEFRRDQAERALERLRRRMGEGCIYELDHPNHMLFATNVDRKTLEELRHTLTLYARIQWRDLFACRFEDYVTVVVPSSWKDASTPGYYTHYNRMLTCRSVGMVLMHEFTHALHHADQEARGQRHPIWISEGLATLFESSTLDDRTLRVEPNHRTHVIRDLVADKETIAWKRFFKLDRSDFMEQSRTCYAQARYVMMYLYESGMLRSWYSAYVDHYDHDKTGVQAMELVFGKALADVEEDWKRWVRGLAAPPMNLAPQQPCLGVTVESVTDGLRISSLLPEGGAQKAGLRRGDVIVKVEGRRVVEHQALLRLVDNREAGEQLRVEVRRDGQYLQADVPLVPLPEAKRLRAIREQEEKNR